MLCVVLDANAIGIARPLQSAGHRPLLDASREGMLRLVVPELALLEVVNVWREQVQTQLRERRRVEKKLVELEAIPVDQRAAEPDAEELARALRTRLDRELLEAGAEIVPLPTVPHGELVERALRRRQPFDANGKDGYRDALMWQTVLDLLARGDDVVLVSNDIPAFHHERTRSRLSDVLAEEVAGVTERSDPLQLFHTAQEAADAVIEGSATAMAKFVPLLESHFVYDLRDQIGRALAGAPLNVTEQTRLGLATPALDAYVEDAVAEEFDLRLARELANGKLLITGVATVEADIVIEVPASDANRLTPILGPGELDSSPLDTVARGRFRRITHLPVELVVDPEAEEVSEVRLEDFDDFERA